MKYKQKQNSILNLIIFSKHCVCVCVCVCVRERERESERERERLGFLWFV